MEHWLLIEFHVGLGLGGLITLGIVTGQRGLSDPIAGAALLSLDAGVIRPKLHIGSLLLLSREIIF
jgi:hypothetical protein